jgi:GntR family transcriptional regulator
MSEIAAKAHDPSPISAEARDPSPIYFRIAAGLRAEIASGRLPVGARLPPIAALARTYAVAPVTVREALRLLTEEGLIWSRQGSGTFVADRAANSVIVPQDLDWPARTPNALQWRARVLQADDTPPPLSPDDGSAALSYRRMLRVHFDRDGVPVRMVEVFVDRRYYDQAPNRFDSEMVIALLEEMHGPDLNQIRHTFTLTVADAYCASQLNIRVGDPVGRLRRVVIDNAGVAVYFAVAMIRADRIALAWTSVRPIPGLSSRN